MIAQKSFVYFTFLILSLDIIFSKIPSVFASMSLKINDGPQKVDYNEEFEVDVSLKDAPKDASYFLQLAFTAIEKSAYFGYTQKNDGTWHKYGESFENFFQIATNEEGSWSGKIKGKPNSEDKDFRGAGNYVLKVGRFTSSGKSHSWSDNNFSVYIQAPTFTPTPLPTSTSVPTKKPSNTPRPSATSKPQNSSPLMTKTLSDTKITAVTLFIKSVDNSKSSTSGDIQEEKILGLDISGMDSNAEEGIDSTSSSKQSKPLVLLLGLIGGGFACIFGAVILSIKKIRSRCD